MRGQFITPYGILLNTIPSEGQEEFLKMIFRDDQNLIAGGANFYAGVTQLAPDDSLTMADIQTKEPTIGVGSYARLAIPRTVGGWPTLLSVANDRGIRSQQIIFTATGVDYDKAINRIFLTDQLTGFAGKLLSISSPLAAPVLITPTSNLPIQYELYLD